MEKFTISAGASNNGSHQRNLTTFSNTNNPISIPYKKPHFPAFPPPHPPKHHHPDTELSIFSAERYFKEDEPEEPISSNNILLPERCHVSSPPPPPPPPHYPRTPSLSSSHSFKSNHTPTEASWNSRTGLLCHPHPHPLPLREKEHRRSPRWRLCPTCPCSGKRSVDVEEKFSEFKDSYLAASDPKKQSIGETGNVDADRPNSEDLCLMVSGITKLKILPGKWENPDEPFQRSDIYAPKSHRIVSGNPPFGENGAFSFPVLAKPACDEPPRVSLEVFRPKEEPRRTSLDLRRRWAPPSDEMRRSFTFSGSPRVAAGIADDDLVSDASSDLFEIESFATTSGGPAYRRRESLDETPAAGSSPARASGCYPPSEVSVQWSVTTAEGGFDRNSVANFSSAASDCGGEAVEEHWGKKKGGGGGLLLMSCRSSKAVNVATHQVRHVAEIRRGGGGEKPQLTRSLSARLNQPVQGL